MTRKTYTSFEQIDQELEILALEKELRRLRLRRSTGDTLDGLKPAALLADTLGPLGGALRGSGALRKFALMWLVRKVLK